MKEALICTRKGSNNFTSLITKSCEMRLTCLPRMGARRFRSHEGVSRKMPSVNDRTCDTQRVRYRRGTFLAATALETWFALKSSFDGLCPTVGLMKSKLDIQA